MYFKKTSSSQIFKNPADKKIKAMKRSIVFLLSILVISYFTLSGKPAGSEGNYPSSDSIKVFSSPDLYKLSVIWANEYSKLNPAEKIRVTCIQDPKIANELIRNGNIGLISAFNNKGLDDESLWQFVIGRDVLVPVISAKNPYYEEIVTKGISSEKLAEFMKNPGSNTWGKLLGGSQTASVNYYIINDQSITNDIRRFLNLENLNTNGIQVENSDELVTAIQKDPSAIGFTRLISIVNGKDQTLAENVSLLPIDRNNNGILDFNERIYDDYSGFSRAVWIGKYPKALISNIYAVSLKHDKNDSEVAFMKWIVNEGQQLLLTNGYSEIITGERNSVVDKMNESQIVTTVSAEERSIFKTGLLILVAILFTGLVIDFAVRSKSKSKTTKIKTEATGRSVLHEDSLNLPKGLFFDKTHTWAFMEQNGTVKVGIDDFIQHITGTLTRLKMKNPGDMVERGEVILTLIQNGKQLNVYAPVSGTITEINSILNSDASILNSSPYNEGWVYRIEPTNWSRENQLLFIAEKHRQFIKTEFLRLKDFLATALAAGNENYSMLVLQDGGELVDNTLSELGPEVWEDFQTKFIDPSRQIWFYELF